jgi:hypothetical protein
VQPGLMEKNAGQALLVSARKILPGRISGQQEAVAHEAALEWEWAVDGTRSFTAAHLYLLLPTVAFLLLLPHTRFHLAINIALLSQNSPL